MRVSLIDFTFAHEKRQIVWAFRDYSMHPERKDAFPSHSSKDKDEGGRAIPLRSSCCVSIDEDKEPLMRIVVLYNMTKNIIWWTD